MNGGCAQGATCTIPTDADVTLEPAAGGAAGEPESLCLLTEGSLCDPEESFCDNGLTCEATTDGKHRCFPPVVLRGEVFDTSNSAAIEAAHVIALNDEGAAVGRVAVTDATGSYELPVPAAREEDGTPVKTVFTLAASAQDYLPFPKGARVALPLDTSEAVKEKDGPWVLSNAVTAVGLIPLPEGERSFATGTLTGLSEDSLLGGVLVVATGEAGTFTAIADQDGSFTLFNLPAGSYTVRAYGAGLQFSEETLTVEAATTPSLTLTETEESTTTVNGSISLVNAPGGSLTSVILVVEETFDELNARGEVPRGLRAPKSGPVSISGAFAIEGVPAGRYVVLAAYENDGLVRDPDTNIAGTGFVRIEVTAGQATLDIQEGFKVTEALATVSPGKDAPEAVTEKPVLEWADDSSEDYYQLQVYDALGQEVWKVDQLPGVSGSDTVTHPYEGPLEPGMYYQFRVTSWRQAGGKPAAPISRTEDLRGVFYLPAAP